MNTNDTTHRRGVVGPSKNFWLYDSRRGIDLTHPDSLNSTASSAVLPLKTTTLPVTMSPSKTALVVIDMQNFFLSPQLGRPSTSAGLRAQQQLLKHAIPAARKAGVRVIWLNWGLTPSDLESMPPAVFRAFGFETMAAQDFESHYSDPNAVRNAAVDEHGVNGAAPLIARGKATVETGGKPQRIYRGLGSDVGEVELEDGTTVDGGKLLCRDTWNAALTPELNAAYEDGLQAAVPDVWIHKDRMSGLWGSGTDCTKFLEEEGIKTLLFAGVNTDQCVAGSLLDGFNNGYDCILLSDGCGTTSPPSCQEAIEFNCAKTWGFCTTCEEFANGVQKMLAG
jgi:nicotinamidase-related amidase